MKKLFKKKTTKVVSACLVVLMLFVIGFNAATAAISNTITIQRADRVDDFVLGGVYGFTEFKTTDGDHLYCLDVNKTPLTQNQTATYSTAADAGILYILENGYPKKNIVRSTSESFYITQAAIWWYLDETQGVSIRSDFKNSDNILVTNYIKPLVDRAIAAKNSGYGTKEPSMKVTNEGTAMTLSKDESYYESSYITASLDGTNTYTVSISGVNGTILAADGTEKNTFNSGEKFKIRVNAKDITENTNVTVKVNATGSYDSARVYTPSDNSYQRVVGLYSVDKTLSDSVNLTIKVQKRVCEFTNGKYYDKNGNVTDKATYTKQCKKSCEFTDGKYYDKDGNVTDKTTYEKQCKKTCEFDNGNYYDKNGNVTDEATYKEQCKNICKFTDGIYYDKDGNVTDKTTYEKQCNKSCTFTDDKYYGNDGREVDAATFNAECGMEVVVPNTSSNISPFAVALGLIMTVTGAGVITLRKKELI